MASFRILPILDKQKVLSGKDPQALKAWGDFYRGQGRVYDALDFYDKASAAAEVEKIRKEAIAAGNLFLYRRTMQILKREPVAHELEEIAARCATSGKDAYARVARGEPAVVEEAAPAPNPGSAPAPPR